MMTLIPAKENFTIWKGTTFRVQLFFWEDEGLTDPQDLTGYTSELVIRDHKDGLALLTLTTADNSILVGNGVLTLFISATNTSAITWKHGVYDLTITSPAGDTDAILYGSFVIGGV